MPKIRMLHLSDLHLDSSNLKDIEIVLDALWKDLTNFPDIDFILFSGDLVRAADKSDDFEKAYQIFLSPLLQQCQLTPDEFFIVPGNHDVQRSSIDDITELGLEAKLKCNSSLNAFMDKEMEGDFPHIERLDNYNKFIAGKFGKKYAVTSNKLFSTHKIELDKTTVGIACLSSSWRATGKGNQHDYGKLIIGERQIDSSYNDIKECNLRIALYHHPLDWLMEFDRRSAGIILPKQFDFLLYGHLHAPRPQLAHYFYEKVVFIQGGCLYQDRDYYNGYSIIDVDLQKGVATIHLRSYYDDRREFDKAVNICPEGKQLIGLNSQKITTGLDESIGESRSIDNNGTNSSPSSFSEAVNPVNGKNQTQKMAIGRQDIRSENNQRQFRKEFYFQSNNDRSISINLEHDEKSLPPLPPPLNIWPGFILSEKKDLSIDHHISVSNRMDDIEMEMKVPSHQEVFQEGCFYIRINPTSLHTRFDFQYEGTFRIQQMANKIFSSGDLYRKAPEVPHTYIPQGSNTDSRESNIPIFPRSQYTYYLRIINIQIFERYDKIITIEFEPYLFEISKISWKKVEPWYAELKYSIDSDGFHYWRGELQNWHGMSLGNIFISPVSSFLREATIHLFKASDTEFPLKNKKGDDWRSIFKKANWNVRIVIDSNTFVPSSSKLWSLSELHRNGIEHFYVNNLDMEWFYPLMIVENMNHNVCGVVFQNTEETTQKMSVDIAIVAHSGKLPDSAIWGQLRAKASNSHQDIFFYISLHSIGYKLRLFPPVNPNENFIMQNMLQLANNTTPPQVFPENIEWTFSPQDVLLLCHLPDIAIRPGGVRFETPNNRNPINLKSEIVEAEGLRLDVLTCHDILPLGAPLRLNYSLMNGSNESKIVPANLSMKGGCISGRVINPVGKTEKFSPIVYFINAASSELLLPGQRKNHSLTLLWGDEAPLFTTAGYYQIILDIVWPVNGARYRVSGETAVLISSPKDEKHARAAIHVFRNPALLSAIVIGGDHFEEANKAIDKVIENPILKPHYNYFKAKRIAQGFFYRKPDLQKTIDILEDDKDCDSYTLMSGAETIRLTRILIDNAKESPQFKIERLKQILLKYAEMNDVTEIVQLLLRQI